MYGNDSNSVLLSHIIKKQFAVSIWKTISFSFCVCIQWQAISLTVIEKVQIAAIILGSLFLIASISWLVWSSLSPSAKWQRQDLLFQICYGMYGFMDIVCIGKTQILRRPHIRYYIFHIWCKCHQTECQSCIIWLFILQLCNFPIIY